MSRILRGQHWSELLLEALGDEREPVSLWMEHNTRIVKSDRYSQVGLLQLQGQPCHLKYYQPKGVLQKLQFRLGGGRGVASFDNAQRLKAAGLTVPDPLGCVLAGGGILLLTEAIEQGRDLKSLCAGELPDHELQSLFERAALTLAAWHQAGFSHGDSKWSNFLVAPGAIYMVDLEAVGKDKLEGSGCTRDLARFTVNAEDMGLAPEHYQSFLARYCAELSLSPESVVRRIGPGVDTLRRRHREKYGERGHRLV